jgi:hypothetical protein
MVRAFNESGEGPNSLPVKVLAADVPAKMDAPYEIAASMT